MSGRIVISLMTLNSSRWSRLSIDCGLARCAGHTSSGQGLGRAKALQKQRDEALGGR